MKEIQDTVPLRNWKSYLLKTFFIGGISLSLLFMLFNWVFNWNEFFRQFLQNGILCVVLFFGNGIIGRWFDRYYSWIEAPGKRMMVTVLFVTVYTIVASFLSLSILYWFYNGIPINKFYPIFVKGFLPSLLIITFFITIFLHGQAFLQAWKRTQIEAEKFKRESVVAQYETLKNQVNPHFLFNSLNVLSTLVHKDPDIADQFIKQLSKVYRYILDTREQEVVPLNLEVQALESFVFLSEIRYGNNIDFSINIEDAKDFVVAPLSLQMLVENAIKHNIISKANPLSISVHLDQDKAYIIVENKLQKKKQRQASSGIGLDNIKARYQYISDRQVEVLETEHIFQVKIPLIKVKL